MNNNDAKGISEIFDKIELLRRYCMECIMSMNKMDYRSAELHFLQFEKDFKDLGIAVQDFKRSLEERG